MKGPWRLLSKIALFGMVVSAPAQAQKVYGPGVTDTEIRIGQTMPYSGPVSAFSVIGKTEAAYFRMINDRGGVNGRKITLISLDDAYSPPKTVEQTRKLVEQEQVFALFQSLGGASNAAIIKYTNSQRVPHLFAAASTGELGNSAQYPWTLPWHPPLRMEGEAYGMWLAKERPNARVGVLYQNDDLGKDYLAGFKVGLGRQAESAIKATVSYEVSDPTVDSQIITLKSAGVDVLLTAATPKFAAQAIRKIHDIDWHPLHLLGSTAGSISMVLKPAGLEKSVGTISATYYKHDPFEWADDADFKTFVAFMKQYYPDGDIENGSTAYGYTAALMLVEVLRRCGDNLTRENLLQQATSIHDFAHPMLLPGIIVNTGKSDYFPVEQLQLRRFDGTRWVRFGNLLGRKGAQ